MISRCSVVWGITPSSAAIVKRTASISELVKDSAIFSLRGSNVRCEFDVPGNIWSVSIDVDQISQVINNMTINAVEAMPNGGTLRLKIGNEIVNRDSNLPVSPGKYVKIEMSDEGVGIAQKDISKIFDPYFSTEKKGSGLGLATSFSIINKHKGHIMVESEPGKGTTVTIEALV